jgi:hypothetical protein
MVANKQENTNNKSAISILKEDKRLRKPLSLKSPLYIDLERLAIIERRSANVIISPKGGIPIEFVVYCKNIQCGDLMDAFALCMDQRWRKLPPSTNPKERTNDYILLNSVKTEMNFFYSKREQDMQSVQKPVFDYLESLPKDEYNALFEQKKTLQFEDLPGTVQDSLREMARISAQNIEDNLPPDERDPKSVQDSYKINRGAIKFENIDYPGRRFKGKFINILSNVGSLAFYTNNYDPKIDNLPPNGCKNIDHPKNNTINKELIQNSSLLNKKISFSKPRATIFDCIENFHKISSMNFLVEKHPPQITPVVIRDANIEKKPLWEALDIVCKEYGGWEWEFNEENFVVLRDPRSNCRRHKLEKPVVPVEAKNTTSETEKPK